MQKFLCLTLFGILIFSGLLAKDYAVIVGINEYENLPPLKYAEKDAYDMNLLLQQLGFETKFITGQEATREGIINCLQNTVQNVGGDDLILFYFSGHGFAGENLDVRGVFPVNTDMAKIVPITQSEIVQILSATRGNKILFLDACYQGSSSRNLERKKVKVKLELEDLIENHDLDLFIAASASNQLAWDGVYVNGVRIENGIATYLFIEGIKTGAVDKNRDKTLTNGEIAAFFQEYAEKIPDTIDQKPEAVFSIDRILFCNLNVAFENEKTVEVEIQSEPSNSRVFINNLYVGNTPGIFALKTGSNNIRLVKEGYEKVVRDIEITTKTDFENKEIELFLFKLTEKIENLKIYNNKQVFSVDRNENLFESEINLLVAEIKNLPQTNNDMGKIIEYEIKRIIEHIGNKNANILTRNQNELKTIMEEKKLDSFSKEQKNTILNRGDFYLKPILIRTPTDVIELKMSMVDLYTSKEKLFETIFFGYYDANKSFIMNSKFAKELEEYLKRVLVFIRSPIKSNITKGLLKVQTNHTEVSIGEEIVFTIESDFNHLYLFTSDKNGNMEYLGSTNQKGELELSAEASIDDLSIDQLSEYLVVFGSNGTLSEEVMTECSNLDFLASLINEFLINSEYAFSFVNYNITR